MQRSLLSLVSLVLLLFTTLATAAPGPAQPTARAAALDPRALAAVPDPLRPWINWVLRDQDDALCPPLLGVDGDGARCVWPTALTLTLGDRGGRFVGRYRAFRRAAVPLPGDAKTWPQDVRVDNRPAVVLNSGDDDDGSPAVLLEPGEHTVTGAFLLDELPESLAVPPDTGVLSVTVNGERLAVPVRDDEGRVFLHREGEEKEEDVLEVTVHRLLEDGVPVQLTTRLTLRVSGKGREVLLAAPLLPGFVPMSIDSPLPARLEKDGRLRVQVRAGDHVLSIGARHEGPLRELKLPTPAPNAGAWGVEEVWAFRAAPAIRVATIEGPALIDPQQTTLPADWRRLPCYGLRPGEVLRLTEQRRGAADLGQDELTLRRTLWLDFDGATFTAQDHLSGQVRRAARLEVQPLLRLGRVAVGGSDQLITRGERADGALAGVEVHKGPIEVSADLGMLRRGPTLPASGWRGDLSGLSIDLNLPPGWRLLHASGVDDVRESWVRGWSLLDLFLVLVFSMGIARLFGIDYGVLALLTLVLSTPERGAPLLTLLPVLAAVALLRVLPEGRLRAALRVFRLGAQVVLLLTCVSFTVGHLRGALYPQLGAGGDSLFDATLSRAEMPMGAAAPTTVAPEAVPADAPAAMDEAKEEGKMGGKKKGKADEKPSPKKPAREALKDAEGDADGVVGSGRGGGGSGSVDLKVLRDPIRRRPAQPTVDPSAVVQTGPGVPTWRFTSVPLRFSGPVAADQRLNLYLIPPWANLLLALLRVALWSVLLLRLLDLVRFLPGLRRFGLVVLPLLLLAPSVARAELPAKEVLDDLRAHLVKPAECQPRCAAAQRLVLETSAVALRMRLELGVAAPTAVPLPGGAGKWLPSEVLLDGRPAAGLRSEDGKLWLQVGPGNHQVAMGGPLPDRETVQVPLPLKPHRVEVRAVGWRVDGVHEDGSADEDLQLSRLAPAEPRGDGKTDGQKGGALQPEALPPYLQVTRELDIGLQWQVTTTVRRLTSAQSAALLELPLLPGESVTTPEVRTKGGKAQLNLAAGTAELVFRSLLAEQSPLALTAAAGPFSERWVLSVAPLWHVETAGLAPIHPPEGAARVSEWRPWPGEKLELKLTRPPAIPGRSLTIDSARLELRPGLRATDAKLVLVLRASRGGQHTVTLPPGATLQSLIINGESLPLQPAGEQVTFPVAPGGRQVEVAFRVPQGISLRYRAPRVDLGGPAVNIGIEVYPGGDRWVLLVGGPRLGPAVLFWGFVLSIGLVSLLLGRLRLTPLRGRDWLLLGLGMSQTSLVALGLLFGFWLCLGWRERRPEVARRWVYNVRQLVLAGYSMIALGVLVAALREGLLGDPDMQIAGYGSSAEHLRWFADRGEGAVPGVWVLSLPLLAYRGAMLLWALWLARALLGWLRWGYGALLNGGLWRRSAKPADAAETAVAATAKDAAPPTESTPPPSSTPPVV